MKSRSGLNFTKQVWQPLKNFDYLFLVFQIVEAVADSHERWSPKPNKYSEPLTRRTCIT